MKIRVHVHYLGPEMSFTHLAAMKYFKGKGTNVQFIPNSTIEDVFHSVKAEQHSLGVVPIENIGGGTIEKSAREIISNGFRDAGLTIAGEIALEVSLYLQALEKRESFKKIYSHPFPIAICREWLRDRYEKSALVPVETTTQAVLAARRTRGTAAIASKEAAKYYGLKIIEKCRIDLLNVTRFCVIGPEGSRPRGDGARLRTALRFSLGDKPGSLCDALLVLKKARINMTRILSVSDYVDFKDYWHYSFLVELEGGAHVPRIRKALDDLSKLTHRFRLIASYPYKTVRA